jgi:hypothetical protein
MKLFKRLSTIDPLTALDISEMVEPKIEIAIKRFENKLERERIDRELEEQREKHRKWMARSNAQFVGFICGSGGLIIGFFAGLALGHH